MITYESICKKLGFDPINAQERVLTSTKDDCPEDNPFHCLTEEESDFLFEVWIKPCHEAKRRKEENDR